jgi:hypothetical protein
METASRMLKAVSINLCGAFSKLRDQYAPAREAMLQNFP